jgi:hypothetical protein
MAGAEWWVRPLVTAVLGKWERRDDPSELIHEEIQAGKLLQVGKTGRNGPSQLVFRKAQAGQACHQLSYNVWDRAFQIVLREAQGIQTSHLPD